MFSDSRTRRVFIFGDLMVDYALFESDIRATNYFHSPNKRVGGTAVLAARAFLGKEWKPIIFGGVGCDADARYLKAGLERMGILCRLYENRRRNTGVCFLVYGRSGQRWVFVSDRHANDYNLTMVDDFINGFHIDKKDVVFLATHFFERESSIHCRNLMRLVYQTGAKIVLDVVPHDLHRRVGFEKVRTALEGPVNVMIGEFRTLMGLLPFSLTNDEPVEHDWHTLLSYFPADVLVLRYGEGGISRQDVVMRIEGEKIYPLVARQETGYNSLERAFKLGFGDRLTADLLAKYHDII